MKQFLLTTFAGRIVLGLRDKIEIVVTALRNPEAVGTMANDQFSTQLITQLCAPGKTFIDVGAHIGSVISLVQRHDASVKIVAVEAIPSKVAALKEKFSDVVLHECAVGEAEGEAKFFINLKQSGYSSLIKPSGGGESSDIQEITVPIKRLDGLVDADDVDAIKIDVEGFELGVLRGSDKILAGSRPVIMFESGPVDNDEPAPYTKAELWQCLESHDYMVVIPHRVAHEDDGLTEEGFLDSHLYPRRTTNYFAIPRERRVEIRDRARKIA